MKTSSLHFCRFLAALIVIIFHYGKGTKLADVAGPFISSGPQMVTFFFVLSGFVLMVSYSQKNNVPLKKYYIARAARILPLYMAALLIMVLYDFGRGNNTIIALIVSMSLLQAWIPPYPLTLNSPAWAVSVLFFFYLCFPTILRAIKTNRIRPVQLILFSFCFYITTQAILSGLLATEYTARMRTVIYYSPLSHLSSFVLGVSGGHFFIFYKEKFYKTGVMPLLIETMMLCITFFVLQYPALLSGFFTYPLPFGAGFYSPFYIILILSMVYADNSRIRTVSLPLFALLGELSYGMYILQLPVHTVFVEWWPKNSTVSTDTFFFLYLAFLLVVSIIARYTVEKPCKQCILKLALN